MTTEDQAFAEFVALRFAENEGRAFCPHCGGQNPYFITSRRKWKCSACGRQFSATSGTIFAWRKMTFVDLLAAMSFVAKGGSALSLSHAIGCQYRTAFELKHKLASVHRFNETKAMFVNLDGAK